MDPSGTPRKRYKLSGLADAAGVPKETIHYYLRIGALPKPRKLREKLALYDENHLGLMRLLQRLQREKRLPLSTIVARFKENGHDAAKVEMNLLAGAYEDDVGPLGRFMPGVPSPSDQQGAAFEIPAGFRERLVSLGILPGATAPFSNEDLALAGIAWAASEKNIPPEFFVRLEGPLQEIVTREIPAILGAIDPEAGFGRIVREAQDLDRLINRYLEVAKIRSLRRHFEKSAAEAPFSVERFLERIYVPSDTFLKERRVEEQLTRLEERAHGRPAEPEAALLLAEAFLSIGRYEESAREARQARKAFPQDPLPLSLVAMADSLLSRTDEAVAAADEALLLDAENARANAYAAMAYLIQAAKVGGLVSPVQWLRKALSFFTKSLQAKPRTLKERLETLILSGRAYAALPAGLGKLHEGISALQETLSIVDRHAEEELGLPFEGHSDVYRVNTYYFLGEAYQQRREPKAARQAWERVVALDPASNFGKSAAAWIESAA